MGSAITVPLTDAGHAVRLVGTHLDAELIASIRHARFHPRLRSHLPESVVPYINDQLSEAMRGAELVFLGVSSAGPDWATAGLPLMTAIMDTMGNDGPVDIRWDRFFAERTQGISQRRFEPFGVGLHQACHFSQADVAFGELHRLDGSHLDSEIPSATRVRVQDHAIAYDAPRMLAPDRIRSEVVANGDGSALAFEPEGRRVPVTLVRPAACDADFRADEWRSFIGDHLQGLDLR